MKSVEARGKTREEAIQGALRQLGVELYEVDKIEILDEGSRGFLGFGARDAHVRLTCQHLHDTPARAESGADRDRGGDRDRGRRGGRGRDRDNRGGEQQQRGQGQERRDGRQGGGQQPRDGQSRGRGGSEQGRGGNDANRGRGRDNRGGGGQQGGGNARPQQQQQQQRRAEAPARENAPSEGVATKHTSVHDEALDALRRAEMFEQAMAGGGADAPDTAAEDRAPLPPAQAEEPVDPITDEQGAEAAELLGAMLDKMGLPGEVAFVRSDDGTPRLDVKSEHTPMLIGRKGHTLNALQYLVNRMLTKGDTAENTERLVVDIEGYVDRRRQSLEDLARTMASRAKESGRIVRLKPLSPQERRIIHMTLRGDDGVTTASHGDSLYRVVSITPAGGPSPRPAREQRGGGSRSGNGGSRRRRGGGGQRSGGRRPQEQDPGTLGD